MAANCRKAPRQTSRAGKQVFATTCVACHGPEGKGTPAMGAPI
ncbi:c-type cytochrome [Pseudomonas aeruginosa]|nr:c-type cytochrome [Pseudomonas aeruginosa]